MLKFYHVKDAKLSLTSHLLKHLIVTKYGDVPWQSSHISRDRNGKPCFVPSSGDEKREENHVEFNVSHQAGIVSLIAVVGKRGLDVGTDVVCVNERILNDYRHIDKDGFFEWVDIHSDVFAPSEVSFMKLGEMDGLGIEGTERLEGFDLDALSRCQWRNQVLELRKGEEKVKVNSNIVIEAKVRRFYAMWCLREAYVKMTGEALLAPWLKELEISDVKVPAAKRDAQPDSLDEGEVIKSFRIHFKEKLVTNVRMELTALGKDFMVGGAIGTGSGVDGSDLELGSWKELDIEKDVFAFANPFS